MTHRIRPAYLAAGRGTCAIVAALALGIATAQSMPKEGNYDYTLCFSGTSSEMPFSKTHGANTLEYVGNNRSNPPGGPFDMTTAHCLGLGSMIDGKYNASYFCEAVDKDGDKFMVRATSEGPKSRQEAIVGTGKYEGMVRTGTGEALGMFPGIKPGAFTGCVRQTGTYKLK